MCVNSISPLVPGYPCHAADGEVGESNDLAEVTHIICAHTEMTGRQARSSDGAFSHSTLVGALS